MHQTNIKHETNLSQTSIEGNKVKSMYGMCFINTHINKGKTNAVSMTRQSLAAAHQLRYDESKLNKYRRKMI